MNDFYDGQWYLRMAVAYVILTIVLQLKKNPRETLKQKTWPDRESNPEQLSEASMLTLDHSIGLQHWDPFSGKYS